jgi:hypothetical protein
MPLPPKSHKRDAWETDHSHHPSQRNQPHEIPYYKRAEQNEDGDSEASDNSEEESKAPCRSAQKVETKTVHFKNHPPKSEDQEIEELIGQLHGLDTRDSAYAAGYARLAHHFPNAAKVVPKPKYWQAAPSTFLHQIVPPAPAYYQAAPAPAPAPAPYVYQAAPPPPPPARSWGMHASTSAPQPLDGAASFFRTQPYIEGCSFCLQPNHRIWMCPVANEYVRTGRVKVVGDKLRLPNNQRIPNDSSGRGIKASIDAWLTSQAAAQAASVPPPSHPAYAPPLPPPPLQHAPPAAHIEEVTKTNILQVTQITQAPEQDQHEDDSLNIFQVFAAKRKKCDGKAVQLVDLTEALPPDKPPAPLDPHAARSIAQYCYHSDAEDQ